MLAVNLAGVVAHNVNFEGADFRGNLTGTSQNVENYSKLNGADLTGAKLHGAHFGGAHLSGVIGVNFPDTDLRIPTVTPGFAPRP